MKNVTRFLILAALLVLVTALTLPAMAQEGEGEGGIVIEATFGSGPDTFSPMYCTGTDCADIVEYLFIDLVAVDPSTESIVPVTTQGCLVQA